MTPARATMGPPSLLGHLRLLWGLRLDIAFNRSPGRGRALAVAAFVASIVPALSVGIASAALMRWAPVAHSAVWSAFILNLLGFVASAVWCTWPLLSAGVDDHSELSRYAAFPISGFRLLIASTLASLLEPRTVFFFAPVVGTWLGFASRHRVPLLPSALLCAAFAVFNAAWSRVGLYAVLNVLREKRSAELIGGFSVLLLIAASFIPPVDTSWLTAAGGGLSALKVDVLANAAVALGRVPSGFFGDAQLQLAFGHWGAAVLDGVGLVLFTAVGLWSAHALLSRFYRRVGRGGPGAGEQVDRDPFPRTGSLAHTLFVREALDLWKNPRARLLAAVPFILAILLKLLSARDLFVFALGASADAWVMGGLCLYGAVVIASTFSQNMFGYDGHGFAALVASPVPLAEVCRAKNRVHAAGALLLATMVALFYRAYFGHGGWAELGTALLGVLALVPVLLTAGNFLSVAFPVKFHASLKRRDKLPFAASMLGVLAASIGTAPFAWSLRLTGPGANRQTVAMVALLAALDWMLYRALFPLALRRLHARREHVLLAVTRE